MNRHTVLKFIVFLLGLLPAGFTIYAVSRSALGANPVEAILQISGEWALRMLLLCLLITPLQFVFHWRWIAHLRRMVGLFCFFYACLHLLIWVALDQGLDLALVMAEVIEKPFITVGMLTFIGLIPLAVTSNRFSVRKLGMRWKALHRSIYLLSVTAVVHFIWQVKGRDLLEPVVYLTFLLLLLMWRFMRLLKQT